ncbi:MAG: HAD family hydrolase [Ruminococcaceae bacterium]|nr:HAD family hydrolase [Oscillospiraceae bacterium]
MITVERISDVCEHLKDIKAVIFDLDDTLYSEKEYVRSGFKAIANELTQVENAEEKLWIAFQSSKSAIDDVLSREGIFSEELKQKCLTVYRLHNPDIHLHKGCKELLEKLRFEGYKLGIITDGRPQGQRAKIEALGLYELVDHIIVTDELGGVEYRKPNKAAYVKMRELLDVAYEEMCYIGDNINKDFTAAKSLGIRSIWFKNTNGLYYYC